MRKKILYLMVSLVLVLSFSMIPAIPVAAATTWTVDDDGADYSGADFTHPQDAVNAASSGDTVLVYPGTYDSRQYTSPTPPHWSAPNDQWAPALIVYKDGLTIQAVDPDPSNTVIQSTHNYWSNPVAIQASTGGTWDGSQYIEAGVYPDDGTAPSAVIIVANDVTIRGFTLHRHYEGTSATYNTAGVFIGGLYAGDAQYPGSANRATVENCEFSDVWHAVYIWHSSGNKILNNTVASLDTDHWAAISTYDGYNDTQIGIPNPSEDNIICNNYLANKGIALGAWAPPTWTSNAGSVVCCNTVTQVGVTYAHGPVILGCNTGGFWHSNTDGVTRIKGITYTGDTLSSGQVNLSASLEYDGSADSSGIEIIFNINGTDYLATTVAEGVASTTASLQPDVYDVEAKVTVCDCCQFTDIALLAVYDPTAGFVTGGGWINSPENAVPLTTVPVTVSGISGDTSTDPAAAYAPYYLRYVGTPPPAGYDPSHNYQWGSPAIFTPSPEDGPVTLQGTIDVDEQIVGEVAMIGLLDADDLAAGNSSFQKGAYIYIYRESETSWKIGPSDGNVGGEIVQTFVMIADTDLPADGILDVIFTVDGTVDGATYASGPYTAPAGGMTLQITGGLVNAILTDSYGDVVGDNSASPEFANGAVLGWDDYLGSNVGFTITVPRITGGSPEGKATFGFVSKYKKGASIPDGQTEFVFKVADLNFHSTSYDWLVVTGSDYARFKGTGTINGEGDYKFMLWAGDSDPDTFRIKIWYEVDDTEFVVYDNGMNQPIDGGNIVVHAK